MSLRDDLLVEEALEARRLAYAPYSNYRVGCAGLTASGEVFLGCNIENESYGVTLCAEVAMIASRTLSGGDSFIQVACLGGENQLDIAIPCGRCLQLLTEQDFETQILTLDGYIPLSEILPYQFEWRK